MPKLTLISLFCETTEDNGGPDEAYLVLNGEQVWGDQSINDQEGRPINKDFDFTQEVEIKLYDRDTGLFDKSDHLGTVTVTADMAGQGELPGKFTKDGADYTLVYKVV